MDPVFQKLLADLGERVVQVEEQILGGRMVTIEMYEAQLQLRNAYISMIADIKETLKNDAGSTDDEAGREP